MILSHPQVQEYVQRKAANRDRWLAGMRRLRDKVYGRAGGLIELRSSSTSPRLRGEVACGTIG